MNRSDLLETFKISIAQATTDLNRYLAMAYDKSAKAYVRTPGFKARFLEPEPGRYLSQIRSVADSIVDASETWIGQLPAFDAAPTPARSVNTIVLRSIVAAIRRREAFEIKYQSLSRPEPKRRWIAPNALGHDGFRWHTRAFLRDGSGFQVFPAIARSGNAQHPVH